MTRFLRSFLFLCVFCLLFLSNCLLHYLTNPMIIIYFVCLSCFFFLLLFLYFLPLLTLTHPPLFDICGCDSHFLNTQITINDVFCIITVFVSLFACVHFIFVCFAGCNRNKNNFLCFVLPFSVFVLCVFCVKNYDYFIPLSLSLAAFLVN